MKLPFALTCVVATACHPAPQATVPQPAAPPTSAASSASTPLSPELERLRFYLGEWSCKVDVYDGGDQVKSTEELAVLVHPVLAGTWLSIEVIENGKKVTSELKGYDATNKRWRHLWVADNGQNGSLSSDGWHGDQMVFLDDPPLPGTKGGRMTFTKISDNDYSHRAETDNGNGFRIDFEKRCHKQT
ncbi:MAG: hypothetical protein AB7P03_06580 [Kofleriaceae bacterium]